jgi:hypothetical protein
VKLVRLSLLLGIATAANAASLPLEKSQTVQGLYEWCKAPSNSDLYSLCLAYLAGGGDYAYVVGRARKDLVYGACAPDGTSYGALARAFVNWTERHPEELQTVRVIGVARALTELWPCRADDTPPP